MNLELLQQKLIAGARSQAPDDRVPYAFEKRIMAHLAARSSAEQWLYFWTRGLWRAAGACVAVAVMLGALSLFTPAPADNGNDLSQEFENTLLASVDPGDATTP